MCAGLCPTSSCVLFPATNRSSRTPRSRLGCASLPARITDFPSPPGIASGVTPSVLRSPVFSPAPCFSQRAGGLYFTNCLSSVQDIVGRALGAHHRIIPFSLQQISLLETAQQLDAYLGCPGDTVEVLKSVPAITCASFVFPSSLYHFDPLHLQ